MMVMKFSLAILMGSFVSASAAFAQSSQAVSSQTARNSKHGVVKSKAAVTRPVTGRSTARAGAEATRTVANRPTAKSASASVPIATTSAASSGGGRSPASVTDSSNALEVRGQSRNLSMMLTLRNRGNDIKFVKPRENYKNEIQNTSY